MEKRIKVETADIDSRVKTYPTDLPTQYRCNFDKYFFVCARVKFLGETKKKNPHISNDVLVVNNCSR